MNSAGWKSVTYCRTVGKEMQKILFTCKNCNFIVKISVMLFPGIYREGSIDTVADPE